LLNYLLQKKFITCYSADEGNGDSAYIVIFISLLMVFVYLKHNYLV